MDTTNILLMVLQGLTSAFCVVLWSILNNIRAKADKTADDLSSYKLLVAERYTSKTELKDSVEAINQAFERHATRIDIRLDRLEERIIEMREKSKND